MLKQDHYAHLGIAREATDREIERACDGAMSVTDDSALRLQLRHIRATLLNPARRAAYDRSLRTVPTPPRGIASRPVRTPAVSPATMRYVWTSIGALVVMVGGGGVWLWRHNTLQANTSNASIDASPGALRQDSDTPRGRTGNTARQEQRTVSAKPNTTEYAAVPDAVAANAAASVLVIESLNNAGVATQLGTAIMIGAETVVTNCHVVQYAAAVRARSGSSEYTAMADTTDTALDLCLLRVPGLKLPPALRGSAKGVQVGQPVFAVGVQGSERSVTPGRVSALPQTDGISLIQTTYGSTPGTAGGGLFDSDGRLVGIATYQHKQGSSQNLAVSADVLDSLRNR